MEFEKLIAQRTTKKVYKNGDKAIKVFAPDYSKSDILNEALNHARVEETELNIPSLIEVGIIDDGWAITTDFIEGQTLQELMDQNPDKLDEYLNMFVDLQLKVHAQKAPLLNKLKDKMIRKISESDLDATTRYDLHTRLDAMPVHNKVCHGDFNPSNVMVKPSGECYILDWSHATQGNASADVARTYLLFHLSGKADIADKYLDMFCTKSDTAKQYVLQWIPIVAASQLVKQKPEEKEFLSKWIDVVDYQ